MTDNYFRKDFQPTPKLTFGQEYNPPAGVPQLVRSKESGDKMYFVENGIKHWITSPEVLHVLGFDFGQEVIIDKEVMRQLRPGDPIKMDTVGNYSPTHPASTVENIAVEELPLAGPAFSEGEIETDSKDKLNERWKIRR